MFTTGDMAQALENELKNVVQVEMRGRIIECLSGVIKVSGMPARIGDLCEIRNPANKTAHRGTLLAEVVGIVHQAVYLLPFGSMLAISAQAEVVNLMCQHTVDVQDGLLGCVLDGYGMIRQPADFQLTESQSCPVHVVPDTWGMTFKEPTRLVSGVHVIDGTYPLAYGQRIALVGSATSNANVLLNMMARGMHTALNVICLIGISRQQLQWWLQSLAASPRREKQIVIVATVDAPMAEKIMAPLVASAIARFFSSQGQHVGLLIDTFHAHIDALVTMCVGLGSQHELSAEYLMAQRVSQYLESLLLAQSHSGSITTFVDCTAFAELPAWLTACVDGTMCLAAPLNEFSGVSVDLAKSVVPKALSEVDSRRHQYEVLLHRVRQALGTATTISEYPEPFRSLFSQSFEAVVAQDDIWPRLQAVLNQTTWEPREALSMNNVREERQG